MGISKKKDWLKWIRKNFAGILDSKTGSMETLIDSGSTRTVNYVYNGSSVIADDEELVGVATTTTAAATAAAADEVPPPHRRPMLPPPLASQDSPSAPNDVYDCCVSLDGIPIKHEFQYTLSDTDGYGKITKNDVEGLASKILESMYGTTANFSSRGGQRTVKVTLSVRQSAAVVAAALDDGDGSPSSWKRMQLQQQQQQQQVGRERRSRSSADKGQRYYGKIRTVAAEAADDWAVPLESQDFPIYGELRGSSSPLPPAQQQQQQQQQQHNRRVKSGAQRYRRDQLIEMVQKSLAENLSFQNQRKSNRPEDYHRTRTKRRQSNASAAGAAPAQLQSTPLPAPPPSSVVKPKGPPKVAWSPYDFEPPAYMPSYHHQLKNATRNNHQLQQQQQQQQQQPFLYYSFAEETSAVDLLQQVKRSSGGGRRQQQKQQQRKQKQQQHHHHRSTGRAVVVGNNQKPKDRVALPEQTKNDDHVNKRARLGKKTYHVHEHHHYHHYNYMV